MEKIKFHVDKKMTCWVREYYEVEAESKEELAKKIEALSYEDGFNDDTITDEIGGFIMQEEVFDTQDFMSLNDNDGWSTLEVYLEDGELIAQNGK